MTSLKHWEISPLSELVDVLDNLRVPVNSSERSKRPGSVPYYGATGQVGTIDKAIFNEELLILGEDGVQFFDPNKPKAYKISGPAWVNNHAHVLRPRKEKVLLAFLLHFLNQFNYVGYANGTTRLKLTQGAMNSIPVHLPPIDEQNRIVELLEDHLSRLDAALADVKQAKINASQFRRSLLKSTFEEFGEHSIRIGDVVTFNRRKPTEFKNSKSEVSFVPMTKVSEVSGQIVLDECISHSEGQRRSLTYFENGDVIFAKITPCMENGKIALAKNLFNGSAYGSTEFHVLTPTERILPDFLRYFIGSDDFRANAERAMTGAVGQRRVPKIYLEDHTIPLPSLEIQTEIVANLDENLSRTDDAIKVAERIETESARLRRALLQSAFNGQLTNEVVSV